MFVIVLSLACKETTKEIERLVLSDPCEDFKLPCRICIEECAAAEVAGGPECDVDVECPVCIPWLECEFPE